MKQLFVLLLGFTLLSFNENVSAQNNSEQADVSKFSIAVKTGYFTNDFKWSIAGNSQGTSPNILSELIWKDLSGYSIGINSKVKLWKKFFLSADISNSSILAGKVTDTDYQGNDRTSPGYYAALNSNQGTLTDFSFNVSYTFQVITLWVEPYFGFVANSQKLHLLPDQRDVSQTSALNSTYNTKWQGVSAGSHFTLPAFSKIFVEANLGYSQLKYSAEADWNVIESFAHPVSFKHKANGYSIRSEIGLKYLLRKHLSASLFVGSNNLITGKGIDELFYEDGGSAKTQFNGASLKSTSVFVKTNYTF